MKLDMLLHWNFSIAYVNTFTEQKMLIQDFLKSIVSIKFTRKINSLNIYLYFRIFFTVEMTSGAVMSSLVVQKVHISLSNHIGQNDKVWNQSSMVHLPDRRGRRVKNL